jgi:serine/threonine protein kinase
VDHLDDNAASELVLGALSPSALDRAERHLAGCRDCRELVAALAADSGEDSNARTYRHERVSASQAGELPRKMLSVGDRVGRYLVLSSLGAGGMGVVFAAYDPNLGRKIALKLLRSGLAGSSKDARNRLRREAQAIAQLSHPNVVSVYDVGTTEDGDLYIAMEFVEGDTLTLWLKKYPRTWLEIVEVFVQAARGLASAHGVGLLHRDFKPDNVLVGGDGRVRVTDFGLARSLLAPDEVVRGRPTITALNLALTATGTVLGTPRYMPPEQITGDDLDARSDQFSFCVALYEALYGTHPLREATSVLMLENGDRARPPPEGTKIPAAVGRAVLRGLERERTRRFPSMGSLIAELSPAPRRRPVRYAGFAVASVLAVSGGVAAIEAWPDSPPAAESSQVQKLKSDLERTTRERDELARQLSDKQADHQRLADELAHKNEEIRRLTEQVGLQILLDLPAEAVKKPTKLPVAAPGTSDDRRLATALVVRQRPIEGCFRDWAERTQGTPDELSEATMVVAFTVTPDGIGTMPSIVRSPELHPPIPGGGVPGMSMLEHCTSEQIARVRLPPGTAQLEVEATVQWSPEKLTLSAKVVGRRQVPRGKIELQ